MIDQVSDPAPRAPRDQFEMQLFRAFLYAEMVDWGRTVPSPGGTAVSISHDPDAHGVFSLIVSGEPAEPGQFFGPSVRGTCWVEAAYVEETPRACWDLPVQPGIPHAQANYCPFGPLVFWDQIA